MSIYAGRLPEGLIERREKEMALICSFRGKQIPPLPAPASFNPKFKLPTLSTYRGEFKASYWAKWRKRTLTDVLPHKSWVSSSALRDMADRAGYQDIDRLGRVCHRLENGAEIGCRGRGRLSTEHHNADSAYEYGDRISDALQDWVVQGICAGPLRVLLEEG